LSLFILQVGGVGEVYEAEAALGGAVHCVEVLPCGLLVSSLWFGNPLPPILIDGETGEHHITSFFLHGKPWRLST
jgi:hypothetical protein